MKYSEIAAGHISKGVTVFLLTLVYPNGQGRAHSRAKTKSGGGGGGGGMYSAATRRDPHLPHHWPTSMAHVAQTHGTEVFSWHRNTWPHANPW